MGASQETLGRVKAILRASLKLATNEELGDDMPLLGGEHDLDSLDILFFVTNVEKELGVKIREENMDRSAFRTIRTFADFVQSSAAPL